MEWIYKQVGDMGQTSYQIELINSIKNLERLVLTMHRAVIATFFMSAVSFTCSFIILMSILGGLRG